MPDMEIPLQVTDRPEQRNDPQRMQGVEQALRVSPFMPMALAARIDVDWEHVAPKAAEISTNEALRSIMRTIARPAARDTSSGRRPPNCWRVSGLW